MGEAVLITGPCCPFSCPSAHKKARSEAGRVIEGLEAAGKAFGRSGIPSFVLEGVLAELQAETSGFLEGMSSGFSLTLSPTKERSGGSSSRARAAPASEQITKVAIRSTPTCVLAVQAV